VAPYGGAAVRGGQALFMDGVKVAFDPATVSGYTYSGFWRLGTIISGLGSRGQLITIFHGSLDEINVAHSAWSGRFHPAFLRNTKAWFGNGVFAAVITL